MSPLLEIPIAVYEVDQFTLAADELKVPQSTVSSHIAQSEQMVGVPLFARDAKSGVTPTQAGRMSYQIAIGTGGLWRDTCEQVARAQEARELLAVSFSHTTTATLLPKALPVMVQGIDGFDFAVYVMNSDVIFEWTSARVVQLGVVERSIMSDSVDRVTLCEDRLVLVREFDGVWMVRGHGPDMRYHTDLYSEIAQAVPAHTMEVSSNAAIVAALFAESEQSLISKAAVLVGVSVQRELGDEFVRWFYALVPRSGLMRDQRELVETTIAALRGQSDSRLRGGCEHYFSSSVRLRRLPLPSEGD